MTRKSEIDWLYRGVAPLFPEQWSRFRAGVPEAERDGDLVEAYYRLLNNPDPTVRAQAAQDWHDWEAVLLSADPDAKPPPQWLQPEFRIARARIVTHYFRRNAWLEDGILLREAGSLTGIPGIMVHGRLDLGAPLVTAWELSRAWPTSELIIVTGAGHSSADPGMSEALIAATNRFARTNSQQ
jgi:proline iminopeptidase